jgi:hypothetical protein
MINTSAIFIGTALEVPYDSVQAEINRLRHQGEAPAAIAAILGLSTAAVDNYLGISPPAAGSIPNAALITASTPPVSLPLRVSIFA